jgi:hypothetical protein
MGKGKHYMTKNFVDLYMSFSVIKAVNPRSRWDGHVPRKGDTRNVHAILMGNTFVKCPLGRPNKRYEGDIKMDLKEVRCEDKRWMAAAQDRIWWLALLLEVLKHLGVS